MAGECAGSTQQHWPFPTDKVMAGYAYILTHPGVPCLMHDHVFSWSLWDELKPLIDLRRRAGIHRRSKLEILCAEDDMCAMPFLPSHLPGCLVPLSRVAVSPFPVVPALH